MRLAAKVDETQNAIVDALLAAGCKVQSIARASYGVPDLLCKDPSGRLWLIECKSPGGKLTPAQVKWTRWWGDVIVVETPEEALTQLGLVPRR